MHLYFLQYEYTPMEDDNDITLVAQLSMDRSSIIALCYSCYKMKRIAVSRIYFDNELSNFGTQLRV